MYGGIALLCASFGARLCYFPGYDMPNIRIHNSSSPTGSPHKQYTYHIEESGEGGDVVGDDYGFPEVELTPPTLDELIATYTETVKHFLFYNSMSMVNMK